MQASTTFKEVLAGLISAAVAFFATLGLQGVLGARYFAFFVGAVAFSCCLYSWRSGFVTSVASLVGATLLLPPVASLAVTKRDDVIRLSMFVFICACVCAVGFVADHRKRQLQKAEKRSQLSELWLQSAQREALLWTWELDLDKSFLSWRDPYAEVVAQEFRSFDVWVDGVAPDDRKRFQQEMMKAAETGSVHVQYQANTSRGRHTLVSRGVVVSHPEDEFTKRLVGITIDLDAKPVPREPQAVQNGPVGQLILALIGLNDLLGSIEQRGKLDDSVRGDLARAREEITRMLIAERAS
jgi:K+-sensing histidine kinase KdpD